MKRAYLPILICLLGCHAAWAGGVDVSINEIRIDQPSGDVDEYFELVGSPGGSLDGLTYIVIGDGTGGSGVIEAVVDLSGNSLNVAGFFVAAEDTFTLGTADLTTNLNFENSDNVTHLLVQGFTGNNGDDLDTDDDGTLDVEPWSIIVDCVALIETPDAGELVYCSTTIGPDDVFVPAHVYRCVPDGDWTIGAFDPAGGNDTPGAQNPDCGMVVIGACCDTDTFECADNIEETNCQGEFDEFTPNTLCDDLDPPCSPPPPVTGACCNTDTFDCADDVEESLCQGANEIFTPDTACADLDPPCAPPPATGACCVAGSCMDDVSEADCVSGGGEYQGDDSMCADVTCPEGPSILINEIRIDQPSSDTDEYFELAGEAGTSLNGLTYIVIGDGTGGSGVVEAVVDLSGSSIPGSGLFVAAEDTFTLGTADLTATLDFENSDNVTHLLVAGFSGAENDDLDADDDGVLDVEPWAEIVDCVALIETPGMGDLVYCDTTIGPDGIFVPGMVYRCNPTGAWTIGAFDPADGSDTPGATNLNCALEINEVRIDQPGTDVDEYFELTGDAGASLDGLSYIVIGDGAGGSGVVEHITDLTGNSIPGSGFFVAAEDTFTLGTADLTADLNFEGSDNVTHLLVANFSGALDDDLDTDDDGTLDVEPWDAILDCVALIETPDSGDLIYCDETVGPDGSFVPGQAYRCVPDGIWTVGGFDPADGTDTPGAENLECVSEFCGSETAGDCFEPNGSPACNDEECCNAVCAVDPFCCDVEWNEFCATTALVECRECGDPATGNCLDPNGTPYCNGATCCDLVCGIDPTCCDTEWTQACADLAAANCDLAAPVEQDDIAFGLSAGDPQQSIELLRGPAVMNGGMAVLDPYEEPFIQSVEFDNLNGISHNAQGNLLGLNFGQEGTGGTIHSFATCIPTSTDQLIGDTLGLGGEGLTPTRLGGLSVSPDNTKIAAAGYDSTQVVVYDYQPGDCTGQGASLSGARETTAALFCLEDTQGTAWLDDNTVLAFSTTGDIFTVDATTMDANVVATVETTCGPGFTDIEYNPNISPYVFAMYSAFDGGTINQLFVLDPNDSFSLVGTFDYAGSMDTTREITLDSQGNLYASQFGSLVDVIVGGGDPANLADGNSIDWYTSPVFASFSGIDAAANVETEIELPLDIRPGACPNPLNRSSNGVLPVGLLGTMDVDAAQVDLTTLQLSRADGLGGSVAPHEGPPGPHTVLEDVGTPFEGMPCACHELEGDGLTDVSMKFKTQELVSALELNDLPSGASVELVLTGSLLDGTQFSARDCITIVPPGAVENGFTVSANVPETFVQMTPTDATMDADGFTNFARSYFGGTEVTATAPQTIPAQSGSFRSIADIKPQFVRWVINGVPQAPGQRTITVVVDQDTSLRAIYNRTKQQSESEQESY